MLVSAAEYWRVSLSVLAVAVSAVKSALSWCEPVAAVVHICAVTFHYRAMHYSAKRGIAIACRLSVCLSVCNVGDSGPHRLAISETNCTDI